MYDSKTGQRLFSPKREKNLTNSIVNRYDIDQNRDNLSNYMYSYAKKFYSKREEFERSLIENFEKTFNMNHTNYSTEVIINRLKSEVFKKIFKIIDRDGKKMISIFNMDIKKLPFNISDILEPILTKIKTENCRIDEESFIDNCNQLFEVKILIK